MILLSLTTTYHPSMKLVVSAFAIASLSNSSTTLYEMLFNWMTFLFFRASVSLFYEFFYDFYDKEELHFLSVLHSSLLFDCNQKVESWLNLQHLNCYNPRCHHIKLLRFVIIYCCKSPYMKTYLWSCHCVIFPCRILYNFFYLSFFFWLIPELVICASYGKRVTITSFNPPYKDTVIETITRTIVLNMQMFARPTAFCFIR